MSLEERENVAEIARSSWPGRQIVNISSCNVEDSLRLLRHAMQGRGSPKVNFTLEGTFTLEDCNKLSTLLH